MIDIHGAARKVIETEMKGLALLAGALRDAQGAFSRSFKEAVGLCLSLEGRLVVTGMGKSGHVARKIAATFASTGTPAVFVHPAEASHGDLGMITPEDVVIALSNSGETPELGDMTAFAGRFRIPLVAVSSCPGSALVRASSTALILPSVDEACAVTRAPTTSTTMMLALGDALAVSVLGCKGITKDDFLDFHPGGKLGAMLKRVEDLMHHRQMPLCSPSDMVADVIGLIDRAGFGCAGVVDEDGRLAGIVTDGDLRRNYHHPFSATPVSRIMTCNPRVVTERTLAAEALALFSERRITAVFIVDAHGKPMGLLHVHDCLSTGIM